MNHARVQVSEQHNTHDTTAKASPNGEPFESRVRRVKAALLLAELEAVQSSIRDIDHLSQGLDEAEAQDNPYLDLSRTENGILREIRGREALLMQGLSWETTASPLDWA